MSAVGFLVAAAARGNWPLAITGAVALGGITGEMLLGHWYLVSPQMPRWALQRLDVAGAGGLVLDALLLALAGFLGGTGGLDNYLADFTVAALEDMGYDIDNGWTSPNPDIFSS